MTIKKPVLCIGEEQPLWQELRALAEQPGCKWQLHFARTGAQATTLALETEFAAVVADVSLPDASGLDLLDGFGARSPECVRFVLSEFADTTVTVQCTGRSHHHLVKPCHAQTVFAALDQPGAAWAPSPSAVALLGRIKEMPSPPDLYFQVVEATSAPDASVEKVGEIIAQDPAMAAKVLQLANSAVFALQLRVNQPVEAVLYIGLEMTKSLVLLAHTFGQFDAQQLPRFSVESLWNHSMETARIGRQIAVLERCSTEVRDQSFTAGLLHDIGKLMLASNLPSEYREVFQCAQRDALPLHEAEAQVFGASHAELAAHLLRIWGLPEPIVEAVALHHAPIRSPGAEFAALACTHAGNVLAHEIGQHTPEVSPSPMDLEYLARLGVEGQLERWREEFAQPVGAEA